MTNTWMGLEQFDCFPNCSCEVMVKGCYICQPAAFFSSISYLIAAIVLLWSIKNRTRELKMWVFGLVLVSFGSFFGHAGYTRVAMSVDFACIVTFLSVILMNRYIVEKLPKISPYLLQTVITLGFVVLFYFLTIWEQTWFALAIFIMTASELLLKTKFKWPRDHKFAVCFIVLFPFYLLFLFEHEKWICSHLWVPGHTLWHIGSAVCAAIFGRWYFVDRHIS